MVAAELDRILEETRIIAKGMGFKYPSTAPVAQVFGPKQHKNHLAYVSLPSFTLPHLMDVLDGCKNATQVCYVTCKYVINLSILQEDADTIRKNVLVNSQALDGYRLKVVDDVAKLYDNMSAGVVSIDAMLGFYFELYGHCDGSIRDLIRSKMASLFRNNLKDAVQGLDIPR